MFLKWFDAREASEFGARLAQLLIERTPDTAIPIGERMTSKKHVAMLHQLGQQVTRFKAEHPLNAYKKAQLGNKFKWTLKDRGYDAAYIDQLTHWLMLKLSAAAK
jgi:hypothetical protein